MVDYTAGGARQQLPSKDFDDEAEIQALLDAGVVITDERRRRPFYFDGRFLAARDLTNEQNYFLTRQADLGQAGGSGVVHGLMVTRVRGPFIRIEAGSGVTTAGEMVVLYDTIPELDLSDIPELQRLNSAFGLIRIPNEPANTRSGIFILALRPVEFTANPIGSYPTSVTGQRTVEDGDMVEGSAITLIPYPEEGARNETSMRRSRIARKIFVGGAAKGAPAGVLPLALVAIDRGVVSWVDPYMVRREVGAEHGDILGMGFAPRALREAHLLQYEYQLGEVLPERAARGFRFAATEYFHALPPAGHMPAAAIDAREFTQIFFPPAVQVELSIVPEDEVAALLEESLLLPPIDLTLNEDELASTSVVVLVPVSRENFAELNGKLNNLKRDLRPAAPGMVARRSPLEALRILKPGLLVAAAAADPGDDEWRKLLSQVPLLWYIRRRNLSYTSDVTGAEVRVFDDEFKLESDVSELIQREKLRFNLTALERAASLRAKADLYTLLSQPRFQTRTMLVALFTDLQVQLTKNEKLTSADVSRAAEKLSSVGAGEGLIRLERERPELVGDQLIKTLVESDRLFEVNRRARDLNEDELRGFADELMAEHGTKKAVAGKVTAEKTKVATEKTGRPEETGKSAGQVEIIEAKKQVEGEPAAAESVAGRRGAAKKGAPAARKVARKKAAKKKTGGGEK
ncbi:MAG TPA: hypothetical protein VN256_03485 [Pyrinomonadaceae bacterium]|nr:hypothetical protein [Pyrinomonadaceae bacterium]